MFFKIIGYALGIIFVGFVGGAAYKLWSFIPMKPKEKKQEEVKKEGN